MTDPLTPVMPPIPTGDIPQADVNVPQVNINPPSVQAVSSLASSIETDVPVSEVVSVLKNTPSSSTPTLTEVNTPVAPTVFTPTSTPEPTTPPVEPAVKSPLFEDPNQIKVPGSV